MNDNGSNVTSLGNFRKAKEQEPLPEMVMVCTRCDCQSWRLLSTGVIECCNCDNKLVGYDPVGMDWRKVLSTAPTDPEVIKDLPDEGGTTNVRSLGQSEIARHAVTKEIAEWGDDIAFIGAYHNDGRGRWWTDISTVKQRDWVVRKMGEIIAQLNVNAYLDEGKDDDAKPEA